MAIKSRRNAQIVRFDMNNQPHADRTVRVLGRADLPGYFRVGDPDTRKPWNVIIHESSLVQAS